MLIPTGTSVGLTSVSLGVIRTMERKGVRLSVFKPIAQPRSGGDAPDQTTTIVRASSSTTTIIMTTTMTTTSMTTRKDIATTITITDWRTRKRAKLSNTASAPSSTSAAVRWT